MTVETFSGGNQENLPLPGLGGPGWGAEGTDMPFQPFNGGNWWDTPLNWASNFWYNNVSRPLGYDNKPNIANADGSINWGSFWNDIAKTNFEMLQPSNWATLGGLSATSAINVYDGGIRGVNTYVGGTASLAYGLGTAAVRGDWSYSSNPLMRDGWISFDDLDQIFNPFENDVTLAQQIVTGMNSYVMNTAQTALNVVSGDDQWGDSMRDDVEAWAAENSAERLTDPSNIRQLGSIWSIYDRDFNVFDKKQRETAFEQMGPWQITSGALDSAWQFWAAPEVLAAKALGIGVKSAKFYDLSKPGARDAMARDMLDYNIYKMTDGAQGAWSKWGLMSERLAGMDEAAIRKTGIARLSNDPERVAFQLGRANDPKAVQDALLGLAGDRNAAARVAARDPLAGDALLTKFQDEDQLRQVLDDALDTWEYRGAKPAESSDVLDMLRGDRAAAKRVAKSTPDLDDPSIPSTLKAATVLAKRRATTERVLGSEAEVKYLQGVIDEWSAFNGGSVTLREVPKNLGNLARAERKAARASGQRWATTSFSMTPMGRTIRFIQSSGAKMATTRATGMFRLTDDAEFAAELDSTLTTTKWLRRKATRTGEDGDRLITTHRLDDEGNLVKTKVDVAEYRRLKMNEGLTLRGSDKQSLATARLNFVQQLEQDMLLSMLDDYGVDLKQALDLLENYKHMRNQVKQQLLERGWVRDLDGSVDAVGVELQSELAESAQFINMDFVEMVVRQSDYGVARRAGAVTRQRTISLLGVFDQIWRPLALMRLGYTQRNLAEGSLRSLAAFGSVGEMGWKAEGFNNFMANAGWRAASTRSRIRNWRTPSARRLRNKMRAAQAGAATGRERASSAQSDLRATNRQIEKMEAQERALLMQARLEDAQYEWGLGESATWDNVAENASARIGEEVLDYADVVYLPAKEAKPFGTRKTGVGSMDDGGDGAVGLTPADAGTEGYVYTPEQLTRVAYDNPDDLGSFLRNPVESKRFDELTAKGDLTPQELREWQTLLVKDRTLSARDHATKGDWLATINGDGSYTRVRNHDTVINAAVADMRPADLYDRDGIAGMVILPKGTQPLAVRSTVYGKTLDLRYGNEEFDDLFSVIGGTLKRDLAGPKGGPTRAARAVDQAYRALVMDPVENLRPVKSPRAEPLNPQQAQPLGEFTPPPRLEMSQEAIDIQGAMEELSFAGIAKYMFRRAMGYEGPQSYTLRGAKAEAFPGDMRAQDFMNALDNNEAWAMQIAREITSDWYYRTQDLLQRRGLGEDVPIWRTGSESTNVDLVSGTVRENVLDNFDGTTVRYNVPRERIMFDNEAIFRERYPSTDWPGSPQATTAEQAAKEREVFFRMDDARALTDRDTLRAIFANRMTTGFRVDEDIVYLTGPKIDMDDLIRNGVRPEDWKTRSKPGEPGIAASSFRRDIGFSSASLPSNDVVHVFRASDIEAATRSGRKVYPHTSLSVEEIDEYAVFQNTNKSGGSPMSDWTPSRGVQADMNKIDSVYAAREGEDARGVLDNADRPEVPIGPAKTQQEYWDRVNELRDVLRYAESDPEIMDALRRRLWAASLPENVRRALYARGVLIPSKELSKRIGNKRGGLSTEIQRADTDALLQVDQLRYEVRQMLDGLPEGEFVWHSTGRRIDGDAVSDEVLLNKENLRNYRGPGFYMTENGVIGGEYLAGRYGLAEFKYGGKSIEDAAKSNTDPVVYVSDVPPSKADFFDYDAPWQDGNLDPDDFVGQELRDWQQRFADDFVAEAAEREGIQVELNLDDLDGAVINYSLMRQAMNDIEFPEYPNQFDFIELLVVKAMDSGMTQAGAWDLAIQGLRSQGYKGGRHIGGKANWVADTPDHQVYIMWDAPALTPVEELSEQALITRDAVRRLNKLLNAADDAIRAQEVASGVMADKYNSRIFLQHKGLSQDYILNEVGLDNLSAAGADVGYGKVLVNDGDVPGQQAVVFLNDMLDANGGLNNAIDNAVPSYIDDAYLGAGNTADWTVFPPDGGELLLREERRLRQLAQDAGSPDAKRFSVDERNWMINMMEESNLTHVAINTKNGKVWITKSDLAPSKSAASKYVEATQGDLLDAEVAQALGRNDDYSTLLGRRSTEEERLLEANKTVTQNETTLKQLAESYEALRGARKKKIRSGRGTTTYKGQTWDDAFAESEQGNKHLAAASSDATTARDTIGYTNDMTATLRRIAEKKPLKPHQKLYWDELTIYLNQMLRNDPVAMRVLSGETDDQIVAWMRSKDPLARATVRDTAVSRDVDDLVDAINNRRELVSKYVPDDGLKAKLAEGDVTADDVLIAQGWRDMPSLEGMVAAETNGWLARQTTRIMKTLGTLPEDTVIRHPFYRARFNDEMRRQVDLFDGSHVTDANLKTFRKEAHKYALKSTRETLYTVTRLSTPAYALRFVLPFFPAWESSMKFWSKQAVRKPETVVRYSQIIGAEGSGGLVLDEEMMPVEGEGRSLRDLPKHLFSPGGGWLVLPMPLSGGSSFGAPAMQSLMIPKESLNVILPGKYPWLPTADPIVQIPLSMLVKQQPTKAAMVADMEMFGLPVGDILLEQTLPFGRPYEESEILPMLAEAVAPPSLKRFFDWRRGESSPDVLATADAIFRDNDVRWNLNGKEGPKPTWDDAVADAKRYMVFRIGVGLTSPAAVRTGGPFDFYIAEARRIDRKYTGDPDAMQKSDDEFLSLYGETFFPYTKSISGSRGSGIAPTIGAQGAYEANKEEAAKLARIGDSGRVLQVLTYPFGMDEEFSDIIYRSQMNTGIDGVQGRYLRGGPGESQTILTGSASMDATQRSLGWIKYRQMEDALQAEATRAGLSNYQKDKGLVQQRAEYVAQLEAAYPAWTEDRATYDTKGYQDTIWGMQILLTGPNYMKNYGNLPMVGYMQEYMDYRQFMVDALAQRKAMGGSDRLTASSNQDIAAYAEEVKLYFTSTDVDPQWLGFYTRFLERDPLLPVAALPEELRWR